MPAIALVLACVCLVTMVWFNPLLAAVFAGLMAVGYVYFRSTSRQRASVQAAQTAATGGSPEATAGVAA